MTSSASAFCLLLCPLLGAADPPGGGWPMWGGTPERNMVSAMRGAPSSWDVEKKLNVRWTAKLGSQTYGNPVVADGLVCIGTNNELALNPNETGDRGVLMCFRESDGGFLWQRTHPKLDDNNTDWPETGLCSTPVIEGGRLYYVSNRGEVVALDLRAAGKPLWTFDMIKEFHIVPRNKVSSSPAVSGNLIFANTSNGTDESGTKVPTPGAPTLIAIDKQTGKLAWKASSIIGRIYDGQWSSPAVGTVGGVAQVVIGEGDGWVRGYDAEKGTKLWEFNTNPKGTQWPSTAGIVISTPVIADNKVYVANGQDPERGLGPGNLYAIDATKRGNITATGAVWRFGEIKRSVSSVAVTNGMLFAADLNGYVFCLDLKTGKPYWTHDTMSAIWGSPMVIDGKLYVGNADGDVYVMNAGKEKKVLFQVNMGSNVYSTFVPANGVLYVSNRNTLFALAAK